MAWLQIVILAIVQGIAEFLPISSSGHLVILTALCGQFGGTELPESLALNIVLHVGTLLSILVVLRKRVWKLLSEDSRVIPLLIVGMIPAALLGLTIKFCFEEVLKSPLLVGCMLPVTGMMLLWVGRKRPGDESYQQLDWRQALLIGTFQAIAVLPGISRSGSTIAAGLLVGLRRDSAATFSFLLAIPAILGATLVEAKDLVNVPAVHVAPLVVGGLVSFVMGVIALEWLLAWLQRGRLSWFAWWCIPIGLAVIAWQIAYPTNDIPTAHDSTIINHASFEVPADR